MSTSTSTFHVCRTGVTGPEHDHTTRSFSGPEIPGPQHNHIRTELQPVIVIVPDKFLVPDNDSLTRSICGARITA